MRHPNDAQLDLGLAPSASVPTPAPTGTRQRAHARRSDPDTSHAAAAALEPHITPLEVALLQAIRAAGARGMTSRELAEATNIDHVTVSPRMRPMARAGVIVETAERRVGSTGRSSIVWKAK